MLGRNQATHHRPDAGDAEARTRAAEARAAQAEARAQAAEARTRAAEARAADAEARAQAAERLTGLAWWEYDIANDCHTWSHRMYELAGRDPTTAAPTLDEWLAMVRAEDGYRGDMSGLQAGLSDPFELSRPDGTTLHAQAWLEPVRDSSGTLVGVRGVTVDITEATRATEALRVAAERQRRAQEIAGLYWFELDLPSGQITWPAGLYQLLGIDPTEPMTYERWRSLVHPEDLADAERRADSLGATNEPYVQQLRLQHPDGQLRHLAAWTQVERDPTGHIVTIHGANLDVTERERTLNALRESEARFRTVTETSPHGIVILDAQQDHTVLHANPSAVTLLGLRHGDHPTIASYTPPEDLPAQLARMERVTSGELHRADYEMRLRRPDGSVVEVLATTTALDRDESGRATTLVSHVVDLTELTAQREELRRLATTDPLTSLLNRSAFDDELARLLARTAPARRVALLLVDLDRFKHVNEALGHVAGDEILAVMARRFRETAGADAIVARLGGDEFLVAAAVDDETTAVRLGHELLEAARGELTVSTGTTLTPTASVGVAVTDDPTSGATELLRDADLALYRAKDGGRDRVGIWDDTLRVRAERRLRVERLVRDSLEDGAVRAHVQPIVDLATGEVVAHEALARLGRVNGLVWPGDFVPVAEETGLVSAIDLWMVDEVCRLASSGHPLLAGRQTAVNVSVRTLASPECYERVTAALTRSGLPPERLLVEITESLFVDDNPAALDTIRALQDDGVRLALDDFGTGYSALGYLARLPLDALKIDRTFTANLGLSARAGNVMSSIIDLAKAHGLRVVAEGVETAEQADELRRLGCDCAQGWHFGRPRDLGLGPAAAAS